jgi:uncharacterized protein (DUF1330 family)
MSQSFVLVAQLWIAPGRRHEFARFEAGATQVMARHGGRIERRIALRDGGAAGAPDEIHVVEFPSRGAYEAYRNDPDLVALAELRAVAIARTIIWEGTDEPPFEA